MVFLWILIILFGLGRLKTSRCEARYDTMDGPVGEAPRKISWK